MSTAVITGEAGLLGSHLCIRLIREEQSVILIDNVITGSVDTTSHLIGPSLFRFVRSDVTDGASNETNIDSVSHFALPAGPADFLRLLVGTSRTGHTEESPISVRFLIGGLSRRSYLQPYEERLLSDDQPRQS
jgi:dTDP-glucose 4,6-dehydratase